MGGAVGGGVRGAEEREEGKKGKGRGKGHIYLEEAKEDVGVDGPFVRFIEHDHGVAGEVAIHQVFAQKHAV